MELKGKKDYQDLLLKLLEPLKKYISPGGARIRVPGAGACYSRDVIEMEAFARPLWGLVPFWAGGGKDREWEDICRRGLLAGTDPNHPEYWGGFEDNDQKFVEMGPIALGMLMAPEVLWNPYSTEEKKQIAAWLGQINEYSLPQCNWYYFRILVNLALKCRNMPYNQKQMEADLKVMEDCYLDDGWYVDGVSCQKDYYSAFAMEFYSQIYCVYAGEEDRERCSRLLLRAARFADEFLYWFDETGAALAYGRSLTYRFAQTAYWAASLFSGSLEMDSSAAKGIINRNLRYWLSRDIFRGDGVLSVGYGYENLTMAERYNAPGSPYWALKTFLVLALPDEHPYWRAEERPLPVREQIHRSLPADILLQHQGDQVCAYVPGVYNRNILGHFAEKYGKFVYSSRFAFSVAHSMENLSENAPDSGLAFVTEDGYVYVRRRSISYSIEENEICSVWSPLPGIRVKTRIQLIPSGHIRTHEIESTVKCSAYDCGFAVEAMAPDSREETSRDEGKCFAEAGSGKGCCRVSAKEGGEPCIIAAVPNTHLLYKNTVIPAVRYSVLPGRTQVETKIVTGTKNKIDQEQRNDERENVF